MDENLTTLTVTALYFIIIILLNPLYFSMKPKTDFIKGFQLGFSLQYETLPQKFNNMLRTPQTSKNCTKCIWIFGYLGNLNGN